MNTKILYIIVSSEKDIYIEQLFISLTSLRRVMPDAYVTLLTDTCTYKNLSEKRKQMLLGVNEIIPIELDTSLSGKKRSRILKTGARLYVKGDFLFVDCDTLITKNLSEIDRFPAEIAACWDTHSLFQQNPYRKMCINHTKKLGFDIREEEVYFNSGVILARDTNLVHNFYKRWTETYLEGYPKGITMDQPSFCITNISLNYPVKTLSDVWNCELKHGIRYLKDAKIIHYLCTNTTKLKGEEFFILNNQEKLEKIKESGSLPLEIEECIIDPFKGISSVTHCFGSNVGSLFQTASFFNLLKLFHKQGTDMWPEKLLRIGNKVKRSFWLK